MAQNTAISIRSILYRHGIETSEKSDASLLNEHFDDLTPELQENLRSLNNDLYDSLASTFTTTLEKHTSKIHRIPTREDLLAVSNDLKQMPVISNTSRKRSSNGRVTKNPAKGMIVDQRDIEILKPQYKAAKAVPSNKMGAKWQIVEMPDGELDEMITDASGNDEQLLADIEKVIDALFDEPYLSGSKKTIGPRLNIETADTKRQSLRVRALAPFRSNTLRMESTGGKDLRIVYSVYNGHIIVKSIHTDHNEYERALQAL